MRHLFTILFGSPLLCIRLHGAILSCIGGSHGSIAPFTDPFAEPVRGLWLPLEIELDDQAEPPDSYRDLHGFLLSLSRSQFCGSDAPTDQSLFFRERAARAVHGAALAVIRAWSNPVFDGLVSEHSNAPFPCLSRFGMRHATRAMSGKPVPGHENSASRDADSRYGKRPWRAPGIAKMPRNFVQLRGTIFI